MDQSDKSLFISDELHEKKIDTPKGKVTIWLKELPNNAYTRFQSQLRSDDHDVVAEAMPRLVALSVCDADGEESMDFEQACRLKAPILDQIIKHILSLGKAANAGKGSRSAAKSGSGTRSQSPSADAQ